MTTTFIYEFILTRFGFRFILVNDQGTHFINNVIGILTMHFLLKYTTLTTYYPQSNRHVKSTNKVINLLLIKLVIENHIDWDEHLHTILYAYCTTFKVTIRHTLFQVVYGLYPLMPTKYLLHANNSYPNQDFFPTHILTSR